MGKDTIPGPFEAYCEATRHSPAPLPEEVEKACYILRNHFPKLMSEQSYGDILRSHFDAQARRLAEVEAENRCAESMRRTLLDRISALNHMKEAAEARVRELEANRGHDTLAIAELVEIGVLCGLDMTSVEIADVLPAVKSVLAVTEASA